VGGEIFLTCPDRPWGPPFLLYNGYRVFPGGRERPGRDADPSPPSSAVGQERVQPVQSISACTRVHFSFTLYVMSSAAGQFTTQYHSMSQPAI